MPCRKLICTNWFPAWLKIEYFLFTLSIFQLNSQHSNHLSSLLFFCLFSNMFIKAELMIPVGIAIMAIPIRLIKLLNNRPTGVMG